MGEQCVFFSLFLLYALLYLQSSVLFFFLDESIEGVMAVLLTKQEEEVETMRSWIKVGASQLGLKGRQKQY